MLTAEAIEKLSKAEAITAAATALNDAVEAESAVTALPGDFTLHDLEQYNASRRRARGTMTTSAIVAFAAYASAHAGLGSTVFIDQDKMQAVAVLNLGGRDFPGHADNLAELKMRQTAPYAAMLAMANGQGRRQTDMAEFLEDWAPHVACFDGDTPLETPKAVAAVRRITIESLRKVESAEQQLSAERSAFESVKATSQEAIPTFIKFTTQPYGGLDARTFVLRLGVLTGADKPLVNLRVINHQQHQEEMAVELSTLVVAEIGDAMPVHVGTYAPKK